MENGRDVIDEGKPSPLSNKVYCFGHSIAYSVGS